MTTKEAKDLTVLFGWAEGLPERFTYQELILALGTTTNDMDDGMWNAVGPSYQWYDGTRMMAVYLLKVHVHEWKEWEE